MSRYASQIISICPPMFVWLKFCFSRIFCWFLYKDACQKNIYKPEKSGLWPCVGIKTTPKSGTNNEYAKSNANAFFFLLFKSKFIINCN